MTDEQKRTAQLIATLAQFLAICVGIATFLVHVGRKDQQLLTTTEQVRELSAIVSDLAKSQIANTISSRNTEERLKELASRLDRLERNRT